MMAVSMELNSRAGVLGRALACIIFAFCVSSAYCQTDETSAADLIKFLCRRPERKLRIGGCGLTPDQLQDRNVARALVKIGPPALVELQKELTLVEARGSISECPANIALLLGAFAQIAGPAAEPQVRRIAGDLTLRLGLAAEDALALSLDLTSYVSPLRPTALISRCRGNEPKDALDTVIVGWQKNDPALLEQGLSPAAKKTLHSLLSRKSWVELRAESWRGILADRTSLGYRFEVRGRWAEPDWPLRDQGGADPIGGTGTFGLRTRFTDIDGVDCGHYTVYFFATTYDPKGQARTFSVDNADLAGLLNLIASCASRQEPQSNQGP